MNLAGRLSLVLCSVAALSTSIALIPQELAIPRDLEEARPRSATNPYP
jgi:hypothetical protein